MNRTPLTMRKEAPPSSADLASPTCSRVKEGINLVRPKDSPNRQHPANRRTKTIACRLNQGKPQESATNTVRAPKPEPHMKLTAFAKACGFVSHGWSRKIATPRARLAGIDSHSGRTVRRMIVPARKSSVSGQPSLCPENIRPQRTEKREQGPGDLPSMHSTFTRPITRE